MKAVIAQFLFESNTFNPAEAELALFTQGGTWRAGEPAVRTWSGEAPSRISGSLGVLEAAGWTTAPVLAVMCGSPAGRLSRACFARIRAELALALRTALPADAIVLHLHGAACATGEDDVEGNLLALVREELGFRGTLVVSLDLHANITRRMLRHADALTAYRTMPHTDFVATGARAARLVLQAGLRRTRTLAKVAALIPPTDTHDAEGRFAEILARARQLESRPGIEDISVFPVQPWLDVAELGTSVVITGTNPVEACAAAAELANLWYAQRHAWQAGVQPWSEIKVRLREKRSRPWILVDSADATTGGSAGRSAEVLRELLPLADELPGEVLLWVVDPAAVVAAEHGAARFILGEQGIELTAQVRWTGEGRYVARGRSYTGQTFSMGHAAVLSAGRLRVVVSSAPSIGADPAFYECVGLAPDDALAVQVKSLMGWRAGYAAEAGCGLVFDGPGCTSLSFARLPFSAPHRDIFPLNENPQTPVTLWQSS
ncbi:MAG: M81 family peptidase [Lacunisphaera sp.]|nr:M81 family peptidase [Lacunisphaera sp.]